MVNGLKMCYDRGFQAGRGRNMERATATTRPITEIARNSVAAGHLATIRRRGENRMSHCYIQPKTAKINRKPCRLEIGVTHTKQTPTAQINRKLSCTSRKQFRRPVSSHSPLITSHCLFHPKAPLAHHESRITSHESRPSSRTCRSAKKQQIRRSRLNPLGLYFLASYAQFSIGRQRALVHNRGTEVAAGYNDKNHTALVGLEPGREHQSVTR